MKKLLLLPLILTFASNAAMADNSVDLRITATIAPAGCSITLAGGDFDLGSLSGNSLSGSSATELPTVGGKTLDITCTGPTSIGFKAIDNRQDSSSTDSAHFGLGTDGDGHPIGNYRILMSTPIADSAAGKFKFTGDNGVTWRDLSSTTTHMNSYAKTPHIYAADASNTANTSLEPVSNVSITLSIDPIINPQKTLDTSSAMSINGSATLELVYL